MWSTSLYEHPQPTLQWGAVLVASLIAALTDLRSRRIPNLLTGTLLLSGLAGSAIVSGLPGLADSLAATVLLAAPFVLLYAFAHGGAGDAKLMGAIGSWLGIVNGVAVLFAVSLCGVVLGVLFALSKGKLAPVLGNLTGTAKGLLRPVFGIGTYREAAGLIPAAGEGLQMPYGIAILLGTTFAAGGTWLWNIL